MTKQKDNKKELFYAVGFLTGKLRHEMILYNGNRPGHCLQDTIDILGWIPQLMSMNSRSYHYIFYGVKDSENESSIVCPLYKLFNAGLIRYPEKIGFIYLRDDPEKALTMDEIIEFHASLELLDPKIVGISKIQEMIKKKGLQKFFFNDEMWCRGIEITSTDPIIGEGFYINIGADGIEVPKIGRFKMDKSSYPFKFRFPTKASLLEHNYGGKPVKQLDEPWLNTIIYRGEEALEQLRKLDPLYESLAKQLVGRIK